MSKRESKQRFFETIKTVKMYVLWTESVGVVNSRHGSMNNMLRKRGMDGTAIWMVISLMISVE